MSEIDRTAMYGAHITVFLPINDPAPETSDDLTPVTGIIFEPYVEDLDAEVAWDPNINETVDPADYPDATVNAIIPADGTDFRDGYHNDVELRTSIAPATVPEHAKGYDYVPGWPERDD